MMKRIGILLAMLLAGCARFQTHTGDFSTFLTNTLESHGASLPDQSPTTQGLPSSWQAKPDEYGIIILAGHEDFPAINRHLRSMFGKPDIWADENLDGYPMGVFSWKTTGCPIQFVDSEEHTQIIILKKPEGAEQHGGQISSEGAPSAPPNESSP